MGTSATYEESVFNCQRDGLRLFKMTSPEAKAALFKGSKRKFGPGTASELWIDGLVSPACQVLQKTSRKFATALLCCEVQRWSICEQVKVERGLLYQHFPVLDFCDRIFFVSFTETIPSTLPISTTSEYQVTQCLVNDNFFNLFIQQRERQLHLVSKTFGFCEAASGSNCQMSLFDSSFLRFRLQIFD